jgi:hypothetical protein
MVDTAGWTQIRDFDGQSRQHYCSTSGQPRRNHEPVFRGSMIDHEGFYDICLDSAKQLATLIGYVTDEEAAAAVAAKEDAERKLDAAERKLAAARAMIDAQQGYDESLV